jgi:hypothetical protein
MQKKVGRRKEENFAKGEFRALAKKRRATASHPPTATCSLTNRGLLSYRSFLFYYFIPVTTFGSKMVLLSTYIP